MAMVENTDAANGPETVGDSNALAQQMPKTFAYTTEILAWHIHLDGFDSYFGQDWKQEQPLQRPGPHHDGPRLLLCGRTCSWLMILDIGLFPS